MRRPTRILAVTVSAVLGVGLGVAAGIAFDRTTYQDPFGLGAPLVNQPCAANEALLVLVSSEGTGRLGAELASNDQARYLETANSCNTAWRSPDSPTQAYVAYLGPFSQGDACEKQMTGAYRGAHVTLLTAGTPDIVPCLCHVSRAEMPTLSTGMTMTDRDRDRDIVYVHALQNMLTTLGRRPDEPTTDFYDPETVNQVKRFQQVLGRTVTGAVDAGHLEGAPAGLRQPLGLAVDERVATQHRDDVADIPGGGDLHVAGEAGSRELAAARTLGQRPAEVGTHHLERRRGHPRLRTRMVGAQLGEDCARSPEVLRGRTQ